MILIFLLTSSFLVLWPKKCFTYLSLFLLLICVFISYCKNGFSSCLQCSEISQTQISKWVFISALNLLALVRKGCIYLSSGLQCSVVNEEKVRTTLPIRNKMHCKTHISGLPVYQADLLYFLKGENSSNNRIYLV